MQWLSVLWMFRFHGPDKEVSCPKLLFLLYQFIRLKYANVDVVFIAHTTTAKEVSEMNFFTEANREEHISAAAMKSS